MLQAHRLVGADGALHLLRLVWDRVWLTRQAEHALPRAAERVHGARRVLRDRRDREVHDAVRAQAHGEARVARHGAVHRVLREHHAVQAVSGVRRHTADHVRWVDVLDCALLALLGKVVLDLLLHELADRWQLLVAASVRDRRRTQELFTRTFSDDDHAVSVLSTTCFKWSRQLRGPCNSIGTSGIRQRSTSPLESVAWAAMKPALRSMSFTIPMPFGTHLDSVFADRIARCASSTAVLNPKLRSKRSTSLSVN